MPNVLFTGCNPEIACGPDGRIIAVGKGAKRAAGRDAEVHRLTGEAWPGLHDAHIHLEGLASRRIILELTGTRSREHVLELVTKRSSSLPKDAWVVGAGWYNDAWPDPRFPDRRDLDRAAGGRAAYMRRKDGHSAWASSAALKIAGIDRKTENPPGGVIDRDSKGDPTGIVRETAMELIARHIPDATNDQLDRAMAAVLKNLAAMGLTCVHSMDSSQGFASWQRLQAKGPLPIRIVYSLPVRDLDHAIRIGVRSGWGNPHLRIWGVKAFLDGSLGSRTAEMLDGTGTARLSDRDLKEIVGKCAEAELNVCFHAIGDGAVRRALDSFEPHVKAWKRWRPRIEHAQCVDPKDMPRFKKLGAIASMQPIHAVADRELADREWPKVVMNSYAWRALEKAGARLAFGSDAPVEDADPILGLTAATTWRARAHWHPELALSIDSAVRAYTSGAAYAAGMEGEVGELKEGMRCDLTVVDQGRVVATVVDGEFTYRRKSSVA